MSKTCTPLFSKFLKNLENKLSGLKLTLILGLTGSLLIGGTPLQNQNANEAPWVNKGLNTELIQMRSRTAKHFLKENQHVSAFISPGSIHYKNASGQWSDISTTIELNTGANNAAFPYIAEKNAVKNYFPANPMIDYIYMATKDGVYKEKVKAIHFLDANYNVLGSLNLSTNVQAVINQNKITYTGFAPNMALVYSLGSDARKFDLQILSSSFLNSIPAGSKYIQIEEEFIGLGKATQFKSTGNTISVTTAGTEVFNFSQPQAFDSNTAEENSLEGSIEANQNGNTATLKTTFNLAWLQAQGRQFPVHLDPVVNYYPSNAQYWTGRQTTSTNKSDGYLRITAATTASWAKFDLMTLPVGASVSQSTYYGYHYSNTGGTKVVDIRGLGIDPVTSAAAAIFAASYSGTTYNSNYQFSAPSYGWHAGILNSAGNNDIANAAGSYIALGFGFSSGYTSFQYQYGYNAPSPANKCYLEIDYTTTPCTGTPGANAVVTPTAPICPNSDAYLTLANSYSVGGLSYMWQSSTLSPVGPWAAVPNATANTLTTPTINVNTWYSVIITCTNSNGSVTATSGSVEVSPTTTNTVPYLEDFEDIAEDNDLPNCSWNGSDMASTCLTYTTIQTQNRVPYSGYKFASFYYSPANDNYFWSNGVWMEAGVTYSASVWYTTEYYTYPTWELNIWLSPQQSTANANVIATTGGPGSAASPTYKQLSNTFTVATSGLYYIGVNGKSNGTCCGYYLSWDDLEITVPCELNTPMVVINTNAQTICEGQSVNLTATGANTYLWSNGATTGAINVSPLFPTNYHVVGTSAASGCTVAASQYINVNPSPETGIYTLDQSVCEGESLYLTGFGADSYAWSTGDLGEIITVTPAANTTYTVIGSNSFGCTAEATILITLDPLPSVQIVSSNPGDLACAEDVTDLTYNGNGGVDFLWISTSSVHSGISVGVNPQWTTTYTLIATSVDGCTNQATYELNVTNCVGLKSISAFADEVKMFPNPGQGVFTLNYPGEMADILITDLSGREILKLHSSTNSTQFNLNDYSDGVYFVKLSNDLGNTTLKLIKQ